MECFLAAKTYVNLHGMGRPKLGLQNHFRIRQAAYKDISTIKNLIADWLRWEIDRRKSIKRAIERDELFVAEQQGNVVGFVHHVVHEDIIDGGLNSFITALYVAPAHRNMGIGSSLLHAAMEDALCKGVVGMEVSTASPQAKQFYENHYFKQFMGNSTMGEIFLELDVEEYRKRPNQEANAKRHRQH
jgi:N-acetylglutamate synthase-like GNAT family acetyltransferase